MSRTKSLSFFIFIFLLLIIVPHLQSEQVSNEQYLLFITVDAFDIQYLNRANLPTIKYLMDNGVFCPDVIDVYPTLTTPNMTSIVTGAYPSTTTIGSNIVFSKEENKAIGGPRFNKAETIAEVFKKAGLKTASVNHFMLQNRGADIYKQINYEKSSELTDVILKVIKEQKPNLLATIYGKPDEVGHKYGSKSKEVIQSVEEVDQEIKRLIDEYKNLNLFDKTFIIISADHGMSDKCKMIDTEGLKKAINDAGFKYTFINAGNPAPKDVDFFIIQIAVSQCFFNRPFSPDEKNKLFNTIRQFPHIRAVYEDIELRRFHCSPNAGDFIIEPEPGYWMGGEGGVHGRMTESYPVLIFYGPNIKKNQKVYNVETIDIVPTILYAMNLPIPKTVDGKILYDAILK